MLAHSLIAALALSASPSGGDLVWHSPERIEKGASRTFVATGTRKGQKYLFRARGECRWLPRQIITRRGVIVRERADRIFGIDFRVSFGSDERRIMSVGERAPQQTELTFIADRDDVPVHVFDSWDLPEQVVCSVDGFEIVTAPAD